MYGTDEEMKLMSAANHIIAGLPIPVDQVLLSLSFKGIMIMAITFYNILCIIFYFSSILFSRHANLF